jgi:hypothetical protein
MNIKKMRRHNQIRQGYTDLLGWEDLGVVDETHIWTVDTTRYQAMVEQFNQDVRDIAKLWQIPTLYIAPLDGP